MNRLVSCSFWLAITMSLLSTPAVRAAESFLHHDIEMTLDPATSTLKVTDRIEVVGHAHLAFQLAPGLALREATLGEEAVTPSRENGAYWIALPAGEASQRVTLAFEGTLPAAPASGRLSPMLSADGGFLPYGIGWLANAGAEDDRVTYRLSLDLPAPYQAVATGEMTEEVAGEDRYRATFVAKTPTEPPSVFAGAFRIDERDHKGLRLRTYFPADQQELAPIYLDQAAGYIDLFADRIGNYPYDGFSMIAAPLPVGLGFPGLTYISSQILRMPFMQTRSLAHEILHNWWANGVFVDYSEGNWSEGMTTYMADYALAEDAGPADAQEMRLGWLRDFSALPAERDLPLTAFRSKGHDADQVIGYNKAAMMLHMLKQEIGAEAFDQALRVFWLNHRFETAAWSDIQASFEAESGRELGAFFESWLTTKGAPRLSLAQAEVSEKGDAFQLTIKIASDRPDYDLLVPVQIKMASGIDERQLRVQDGQGEAVFNLEERPISIGVDQEHELFRHLAADEAPPILRDVTLSGQALTMIAAGDQPGAEAIAEQLAGRTLRAAGVQRTALDDAAALEAPVMLIGLSDQLAPVLAKIGVEEAETALNGQATARSWMAKRQDAPPVLVVEANDEAALEALLRPLPHYGRYSYLAFEGRQVVDKGVWPMGANGLTKNLN